MESPAVVLCCQHQLRTAVPMDPGTCYALDDHTLCGAKARWKKVNPQKGLGILGKYKSKHAAGSGLFGGPEFRQAQWF